MRFSAPSLLAGALLMFGGATSAEACIPNWRMIFFESGSSSLDQRARTILENAQTELIALAGTSTLRLGGAADRSGSAASNLRLSRRRAEAVRDYLAAIGVPWGSMEIVALGETRLLLETPDGISEPQNRYVELIEIAPPAELERRAALREASGGTALC